MLTLLSRLCSLLSRSLRIAIALWIAEVNGILRVQYLWTTTLIYRGGYMNFLTYRNLPKKTGEKTPNWHTHVSMRIYELPYLNSLTFQNYFIDKFETNDLFQYIHSFYYFVSLFEHRFYIFILTRLCLIKNVFHR